MTGMDLVKLLNERNALDYDITLVVTRKEYRYSQDDDDNDYVYDWEDYVPLTEHDIQCDPTDRSILINVM